MFAGFDGANTPWVAIASYLSGILNTGGRYRDQLLGAGTSWYTLVQVHEDHCFHTTKAWKAQTSRGYGEAVVKKLR